MKRQGWTALVAPKMAKALGGEVSAGMGVHMQGITPSITALRGPGRGCRADDSAGHQQTQHCRSSPLHLVEFEHGLSQATLSYSALSLDALSLVSSRSDWMVSACLWTPFFCRVASSKAARAFSQSVSASVTLFAALANSSSIPAFFSS